MKKEREPINSKLRFEILKRDGFRCVYCGRSSKVVELEVDHIIPVAQGGGGGIENLVTSCSDCNIGKSSTLLTDDTYMRIQEFCNDSTWGFLTRAFAVTNKTTGVSIALTSVYKLIFMHLVKVQGYCNDNNLTFTQSQDSIGDFLGIERKTVGKAMADLDAVGLVTKVRSNTFCSQYEYRVIDCLDSFTFTAKRTGRYSSNGKITVERNVVDYDANNIVTAELWK